MWSHTVLHVAMGTALWSVAHADVKRGESEHFVSVIKQSRARWLTHTFVAMIMRQKCAADKESVFVGSVFVGRAAKSLTRLTMGSSVNAAISAVISTEDGSVEGRAGVSAGCANVTQDLVVERASALSAWSLVCHRMERFVRAEGSATVVHAVATTTASKVQLVSFALLAPASAPCTENASCARPSHWA